MKTDVRKHTDDLADFLDRLTHDMREPLRSIGVFAEVLEEGGTEPAEERARAIGEIRAGTTRITKLLEGLSGYAVALRKPKEVDPPVSLKSALTIVLGELDESIRSSGASVSAENLPAVGVSFDRLIQLMRIVVGNALRFRSEAAPVVR